MKRQRGVALIIALGIVALCLAVALVLALLATANTQTVGNAYQKQQYYNVAEAGIDRGLRDADSTLPTPGASGFLSATPTPPPPPTVDQTPLPNIPGIPYHYSYWYNNNSAPTSTADPFVGSYGVPPTHPVNVPPHGLLLWAFTTVGNRDVAVEAIAARVFSFPGNCALCSAQGINLQGTACGNCTPAPAWCNNGGHIEKVCTDLTPSPRPSWVPVIAGGSYTYVGTCLTYPCAYGDGYPTPDPSKIQQNASSSTIAGFLSTQGPIDQLSDAAAWAAIANGTTIKYVECGGGTCTTSQLTSNAPSAGQITYVNGSIALSAPSDTVTYSGLFIAKCVNISGGGATTSGGTFTGNGVSAETIAWGTDAQCASVGSQPTPPGVITINGNGFWNGGTAFAPNGSINIAGTGRVKYVDFYGAAIAGGPIYITGNGNFSWESQLQSQLLNLGRYAINSFAQY